MLRIRIVSAGIIIAIAALVAANAAAAQTATNVQTGKPIALLAGLKPPHESKYEDKAVHAKASRATNSKVATHRAEHRKLASRKHHAIVAAKTETAPVEAVQPDAPANTQPMIDPIAPTEAAAPPLARTQADNGFDMSAMVVGGQTVQIASPDQVNAIDLAADDGDIAKADPAKSNDAVKETASNDTADPAPAVRTVYAAPISKDTRSSSIGSASWIAQVLAALGGTVTAGVVAWLLIGGGPQRTYG